MLGELYRYFKVNFGKRLILYTAIIIGTTILGTPLLPNIVLKLTSLIFLTVANGVFVPIFVSQFASHLKLLFIHRNRVKLPVSKEIADLSRRMGVRVKELGIVKGCTAYVIGKTIVLGTELLKRLTFEQRQAVVAHELGHIKKRHRMLSAFSLLLIVTVAFYCFSTLYVPTFFIESQIYLILVVIMNVTLLVFVRMTFIPISWYLEMKADEVAAEFGGKENIKSALLAIADKKDLKEPSETHPSIVERIKHIDKL